MERHISREYAFPLEAFALSFWWAWVYLTFLGSSHAPLMWNGWLIGYPAISFSSVLSGALVYAAMIPLLRKFPCLQTSRKMTLGASALTSLSTLAINAPLAFGSSSGLIVLVASFASGIGISLLYVQLGAYYAGFTRKQLQSSTLVSFLVGICIAALAVDRGLGTPIVDMMLPWGIAILLLSAQKSMNAKTDDQDVKRSRLTSAAVDGALNVTPKRSYEAIVRILPVRTVALIMVLSTAFGLFRAVLAHPHDQAIAVPLSFAACIVLVALILIAVLGFSISLNVELVLYVALLIMALTALGLSVVEEANWAFVWAAVLATVRCCDLVMWILFGEAARGSSESAGSVFAFGKLIGQISVACGLLAGTFMADLSSDAKSLLLPISLILIVVLLIIGASAAVGGTLNRSKLPVEDEGCFHVAKPDKITESLFASIAERYGLTKREAEVLEYLVYGRTIPSIAEKLVLAPSTVRTHVKGLYRKLDIHSRQELLDFIETFEVQ